ncbi:hypothetical protein L1887_54428 [Cichorium endivia]|nr:hypothetical protein L1887_54428 [Cichorium endivia]
MFAEDDDDDMFAPADGTSKGPGHAEAGTKEMDMLTFLNAGDPEDKKHIIQLLRNFDHKNHMCLVFENLHSDLREVLKKFWSQCRNQPQGDQGLRTADVPCTYVLVSIAHQRSYSECRSTTLSICGPSAAHCSNFTQAASSLLAATTTKCCAVIQECRGKFPKRLIIRSTLAGKHFEGGDPEYVFISQERDKITGNTTMRPMNFAKTVPGKDLKARLTANARSMAPAELKELHAFIDLLDKCLQLDPARRISPQRRTSPPVHPARSAFGCASCEGQASNGAIEDEIGVCPRRGHSQEVCRRITRGDDCTPSIAQNRIALCATSAIHP